MTQEESRREVAIWLGRFMREHGLSECWQTKCLLSLEPKVESNCATLMIQFDVNYCLTIVTGQHFCEALH